jgi:hypothetical protein
MLMRTGLTCALFVLVTCVVAFGQSPQRAQKWVASWAASAHGPYPSGNASAQPVLDFAFESAAAGANDQTFRLIIRPDLWGRRGRLRFSNAFGTRAVTFDDVFVGLHGGAGTVAAGTNARVRFGGKPSVTIEPGRVVYSDAVKLEFVKSGRDAHRLARKHAPAQGGLRRLTLPCNPSEAARLSKARRALRV